MADAERGGASRKWRGWSGLLGLPSTATERLVPIDLPQSSVGAPLPHVFADEHRLLIGYIVQVSDPDWDGKTVRAVGPDSDGQPCALVTVDRYVAFQFGPPNDEAIHGHRLYKAGLTPYSSFEVLNSKWIADLEIANRVHPRHRPEFFADYRHIILTFHDSTVEFIAEKFAVHTAQGAIRDLILGSSKDQGVAEPDRAR